MNLFIDCYDSSGACHPLNKRFTQNCSQCVYSNNDCIIECDPLLCPSVSNNCDKQIPTTDGCCMTCAPSEGTYTIQLQHRCNYVFL